MNTKYIAALTTLILASTMFAVAEKPADSPLSLIKAEIYKDGGTLRFDLLVSNGSNLAIFVDGRIHTSTPGVLYLNTYPQGSHQPPIALESAMTTAFFTALNHWLNDHYSEEQKTALTTASPEELRQEDFWARWILGLLEKRQDDNTQDR